MKPDGSDVKNLSQYHDPNGSVFAIDEEAAWSADGQKIVWSNSRPSNDWDIWVMNADGGGQVNLTNDAEQDKQPTWSPDGTKIAWARDDGVNSKIWTINADGSNRQPLAPYFGLGYPAWSPDGSKIAYEGPGGLNVINADGSGEETSQGRPTR